MADKRIYCGNPCGVSFKMRACFLAYRFPYFLGNRLYTLRRVKRIRRRTAKKYAAAQAAAANSIPLQPIKAAQREPQAQIPAAKSSVRLEHAIAVTDKLLTKNLAKSDRQELEKLKNTLAVLKIKGTLNPTEADILNENFNALLKLMAKYNV